jgi:F-type H+-transporting ATPase subunit epsilon
MKLLGMTLKILLPSEVFAERHGVTRIVAETRQGSFGLLPGRLGCVAALLPGILAYSTEEDGEVYVAIDKGVLVKAGLDVTLSVRSAFQGTDLAKLHEAMEQQFLSLSAQDKSVRQALAKMESAFVRRLAGFPQESGF